MDDKLGAYFQSAAENPPRINEQQIAETLSLRRKRFSIIMLSLAAGLWALLFYAAALWVGGKVNPDIAKAMLLGMALSYICAGCFAGIVVKHRKVGL
ncbi:MAG: hypothetical protein LBM28_06225 [Oscillospiraceae bacterium]|jgi:hypothetical protein|nr:hypothetical protein [Oscillospiraceae bacterium]